MSGNLHRFASSLETVPLVPFTGNLHRLAALEAYEQPNQIRTLLYDQGPMRSAGGFRFTPPGVDSHPGIYAGLNLMTAGSEFARSRERWENGDCPHHVGFTIKTKLAAVLDLSHSDVLQHLGLTAAEISMKWLGYAEIHGTWPLTWALGKAAFDSGRIDGVLFPSTKNPPHGRNLLIFTPRLDGKASWIEVLYSDGRTRERIPVPST